MYTCEICKKEHDGLFQSGRFCSIKCKSIFIGNKNKNGKLIKCEICKNIIKECNYKRHLSYHNLKEKKQQEKLNTIHICEYCHKEHKMTYASGRFCCKECARGFSTNNNKEKRKEINEKISKKTKGITYISLNVNNKNKRIKVNLIEKPKKICKSCGEIINSNNKKKYCDECNNFIKYEKLFEKLKIYDNNIKLANHKALEILKDEYFINKLSSCDLQKKYKIQLNTLHFYFKKNGINLRNNHEANILCYENGKLSPRTLNCYKHGWHKTWDNKNVYLRSSYEFDYAKELDAYKIPYEVENKRIRYFDTIKQKERIAIVDFYLPNSNMLVEIKSSYTLNLQNMKDKFKQYKKEGYNTKLISNHLEIKI
jgi:hypothetical protein